MATLEGKLTLADAAKRTDPQGNTHEIAEVISEENPSIDDMMWVEGNRVDGHEYADRLALASPTYRKINAGVAPTKSVTGKQVETCALMEARSEIDIKLVPAGGAGAAFRKTEDDGFLAGFAQEVAGGLFVNDTNTDPERFLGLGPRYDDTTTTQGGQIILGDSGASGADQASIWLIGWHPRKVHGIFPKGSKAGLLKVDKGEIDAEEGVGSKKYRAWLTLFNWDPGLVVRDYRAVIRVANCDTSALVETAATGTDLGMRMLEALAKRRNYGGNWTFYLNETLFSMLIRQLTAGHSNGVISQAEVRGELLNHFMNVPMRIEDALLTDESVVS